MRSTSDQYKVLLRLNFYGFILKSFNELNSTTEFLPNWHIQVIAAELEKCQRGETKRLIINIPPRSLKSHCASIAFPAFLLGHNPSAQIICASYGQQLADKLASDCRSVMKSSWYKDVFPGTRLAADRQAVHDFGTTRQGFRFSTSVGGPLTGRGADYIIVDDPLKPDEALSDTQRNVVNDWYKNSLVSRLNDKRDGRIIIIMQRLHEDDLVGHVQSLDDWRVLKFPAIAQEDESYTIGTPYGRCHFVRKAGEALHPQRESLAVYNQLRVTLGEYNFAGQYQQAPAPLEGGLVKASWFKKYAKNDRPQRFETIVQSWDTANKASELNAYSVCTTWGIRDKKIYLLNVFRRRLEYPDLKRAVRDQAVQFQPDTILIEDKGSGTSLIQDLKREGVCQVKPYNPEQDKIVRLNTVTALIERGSVFLPEDAPWLEEYLRELTMFPNGKYTDQADSTSQALDWIKDRLSRPWLEAMGERERDRQKTVEGDVVITIVAEDGPPPKEPKPSPPFRPAVSVEPDPASATKPVVYRPNKVS